MRSTALGALPKSQKKTPPKAGFLGFSLGVLPCFHSVKKPSSQMNYAPEIPQSKTLRISWLTDLRNLLRMGSANSSQGLAPHTPQRRLSRLLFLCLLTLQKQAATH